MYGTTVNGTEIIFADDYNFTHTIILTGLQAKTTYYYKIYLTDSGGTRSQPIKESTFTTIKPNNPPPAATRNNQTQIYLIFGLIIICTVAMIVILTMRKRGKKNHRVQSDLNTPPLKPKN